MRDDNAPDAGTDAELRRRIEKARRNLDSQTPLFELDYVDDGWLGRCEPAELDQPLSDEGFPSSARDIQN